jgi:hypothetical protein
MGVSVHTLRRRIRRGELAAVKNDRGSPGGLDAEIDHLLHPDDPT